MIEALAVAGRLERTLVVETADHGESFRADRPRRVASMYEEVLRIPMTVHLPKGLTDRLAPLRANRGRRVTNLDIVATLLDLWGDWPLPQDRWPRLGGLSLFRPIPPDREVLAISDCAILDWNPALAMYRGDRKWMVDAEGDLKLFDLATDPDESRDLAPATSPVERAWLAEALGRRGVALEARLRR